MLYFQCKWKDICDCSALIQKSFCIAWLQCNKNKIIKTSKCRKLIFHNMMKWHCPMSRTKYCSMSIIDIKKYLKTTSEDTHKKIFSNVVKLCCSIFGEYWSMLIYNIGRHCGRGVLLALYNIVSQHISILFFW